MSVADYFNAYIRMDSIINQSVFALQKKLKEGSLGLRAYKSRKCKTSKLAQIYNVEYVQWRPGTVSTISLFDLRNFLLKIFEF